jgi:hypothetical protein
MSLTAVKELFRPARGRDIVGEMPLGIGLRPWRNFQAKLHSYMGMETTIEGDCSADPHTVMQFTRASRYAWCSLIVPMRQQSTRPVTYPGLHSIAADWVQTRCKHSSPGPQRGMQ